MELIQEIIYEQNKQFLQRIANDMFVTNEDKDSFLIKYHKKHFSYFQVIKQDKTDSYQKKIDRCVK